MKKRRLAEIEAYIFDLFRQVGVSKIPTTEIFQSTTAYANADMVRALEDLEKTGRLLVRYTEEGSDWTQLTREGIRHAGLNESTTLEPPGALPHPPKSSTT